MTSFIVAFSIGMALHAYRDAIPFSPRVAWLLVGLYLGSYTVDLEALALPFMAGYGAIVLAHHWPARLEGYDDWIFGSYGLYIWAFPVQQLLIMAGADKQWSLTLAALPLTYLCGCLSWRYIEVPTQSLRRYLPRRTVPPDRPPRPPAASQREREGSVPAASA